MAMYAISSIIKGSRLSLIVTKVCKSVCVGVKNVVCDSTDSNLELASSFCNYFVNFYDGDVTKNVGLEMTDLVSILHPRKNFNRWGCVS